MRYNHKETEQIKKWLEVRKCERCESTHELTIDHIIPINFLIEQLGATRNETFDFDNFQALCRRCNTLKSGRFDLSNPKTKELLIRFANKYCK